MLQMFRHGRKNGSQECVALPMAHLQLHFFTALLHQRPTPAIPNYLQFSQSCAICHSSASLPGCSLCQKSSSHATISTSKIVILCLGHSSSIMREVHLTVQICREDLRVLHPTPPYHAGSSFLPPGSQTVPSL